MKFDIEKARAQDAALEDAGITDEEVREAIDGYLQAAKFTGITEDGHPLDGTDYAWSSDAQDQARDDVIDFIVANVSAIREFQRVTGHGWLQVGIDFSLTRNGHGAGFWSRGTGKVVDDLTEAAHSFGGATVIVNSEGEMDFA